MMFTVQPKSPEPVPVPKDVSVNIEEKVEAILLKRESEANKEPVIIIYLPSCM